MATLTLVIVALVAVLLAWTAREVLRLRAGIAALAALPRLDDLRTLVDAAAAVERLRPLEETLRRMGEAVARLPAPAEAKDLLPLHERFEMVARQLDELRVRVDEVRARAPVAGAAAPVAPAQLLLRALEARGFERVHILGEIAPEEGGDPRRVPVEASRAGMSFKGFVTVEDGRLVEVALKPLTGIFP